MGARGPIRLGKQYVIIYSHNLRGSHNSAKKAELTFRFHEKKIWAVCFQETQKHGGDMQGNEGHAFLEHGLAEKVCRRESQDLAIALRPDARRAWERAVPQRLTSGPRILATRLIAVDPAKRPLTIFPRGCVCSGQRPA